MIYYDEPLYRPPAEANSVIIQATLGCSFNKCTFCTMYETKEYKQRPLDEVFSDIDTLAKHYPHSTKMFLADGDALALDTNTLVSILEYAYIKFSKLRRVSLYASAFNIHEKTLEELILLKEKGLGLIYYGIESGSYEILKKIQKPISHKKMINSLDKVFEAKIKSAVTVILGVGGKKYSKEHINETVKLINKLNITYLSTLQLMLENNREEKFIKNFKGEFFPLNDKEMLEEQLAFVSGIEPLDKIIFRSNHVSNSLPLAGTFPKDQAKLIATINFYLDNY